MAISKKKLIRPLEGKMIAGVCKAFANYFDVDVTLIRVVWALLVLPGGIPGLLPYIIAWIVIPSEKN